VDLADLISTSVRPDAEHLVGCLRRHSLSALSRTLALRCGRSLFDTDIHVALRAAALDGELDLVTNPRQPDAVAKLGAAAHRRAVDRDNQIIGAQPRPLGRRARLDPSNHRALGVLGAERLR